MQGRINREEKSVDCVHCGDPLSDPWHIGQEESLPQLRIGSLVVAKKASEVCDPGELARIMHEPIKQKP